jgi:hypothetical protein
LSVPGEGFIRHRRAGTRNRFQAAADKIIDGLDGVFAADAGAVVVPSAQNGNPVFGRGRVFIVQAIVRGRLGDDPFRHENKVFLARPEVSAAQQGQEQQQAGSEQQYS